MTTTHPTPHPDRPVKDARDLEPLDFVHMSDGTVGTVAMVTTPAPGLVSVVVRHDGGLHAHVLADHDPVSVILTD